jgi:hypothetical protein
MSLTNIRKGSLKDKLAAKERDLIKEDVAVEAELDAVRKAKSRVSKN